MNNSFSVEKKFLRFSPIIASASSAPPFQTRVWQIPANKKLSTL